jgi:hypothetical protein
MSRGMQVFCVVLGIIFVFCVVILAQMCGLGPVVHP